MQGEKEEQRLGRNKKTSVDKSYIENGDFRKKFDKISESKCLNRLLYHLAKAMLMHRSGTIYEDMYWIDVESNKVVAKITDSTDEGKIIYPESVKRIISRNKGLMTIHSHPSGLPPSVADFNSNYEHDYSLGVIAGHNGKVFVYWSNELITENYFEQKVAQYRLSGYNEDESRKMTLDYCVQHFDIYYKEVTTNE